MTLVCSSSMIVRVRRHTILNITIIADYVVDVDECVSSPCQNGGNCTDGVNGYKCACVDGYEGDTCETSKFVCMSGFVVSHSKTHKISHKH